MVLLFCGAAPVAVINLQEGVNGYQGTQDVSLNAGKGGSPDANYGADDFLQLWEREADVQNLRRSLIRFDLSSIKLGTAISAVTLTLFTQGDHFGSHGVTNSLHLIDQRNRNWRQGTGLAGNLADAATWNYQDRSSRRPWAGGPGLIAGVDYHATAAATAATPDTTDAEQKSGGVPMEFVLNAVGIAAIQHWINHPASNAGFFVRQPDDSLSVDTFWSSEASNASVRPLLTLTVAPGRSSPARWLIGAADPQTPGDFSRNNWPTSLYLPGNPTSASRNVQPF